MYIYLSIFLYVGKVIAILHCKKGSAFELFKEVQQII